MQERREIDEEAQHARDERVEFRRGGIFQRGELRHMC